MNALHVYTYVTRNLHTKRMGLFTFDIHDTCICVTHDMCVQPVPIHVWRVGHLWQVYFVSSVYHAFCLHTRVIWAIYVKLVYLGTWEQRRMIWSCISGCVFVDYYYFWSDTSTEPECLCFIHLPEMLWHVRGSSNWKISKIVLELSEGEARLLSRGFSQVKGVNCRKTFGSMVKFRPLRILIALLAHFDLELKWVS